MAGICAIRIRIAGRVQGVGFRAWTQRRATEAGVSGWVRNRADGDVEALLSGPAEAVESLLAACREGPRGSGVTGLEVLGPADPRDGPFTIRSDRSN